MSFFEIFNQDKLLFLKNKEYFNEDFSGKDLLGFYIMESCFHSCKFENLIVKCMCFGGGKKQSVYTNCSFNRSELNGPTGGNARFENCTFHDMILTDFYFHKCEFINCSFTGKLRQIVFQSRIYQDDLSLTNRDKNEFSENNFIGAEFSDVRFEGEVDFSKLQLPKTDKYIMIRNGLKVFEEFKRELIESNDENLKKCSYGLFMSLRKLIVQDGQDDYFLELNDYPNQRKVNELLIKIVNKHKMS